MGPHSVGRTPRGLLVFVLPLLGSWRTSAQTLPVASLAPREACVVASAYATRAFPSIEASCGPRIEYLGMYSPEGKYIAVSRLARLRSGDADRNFGDSRILRPNEVPPFVNLRPRERIVENYEPPARARKSPKGQSAFSALRDQIITLVYGREKALQLPAHVVTDSRGRLIVSDPAAKAIHVLDPAPFRIAGGDGRRLQSPNAVAVDADDNIYVADSARGLILVYDPDGRFLRYIGKIGNEGLFHSPTGLAIDRSARRIYLADSPRNVVFVLDLEGNIVDRIGRCRGHESAIEFDAPTEVALSRERLVVLDAGGTRVQIFDLAGNLLRQLPTRIRATATPARENGLAIGPGGEIYVSNLDGSGVRVYDAEGRPLSSFGRAGMLLGEFLSPAGLWIDGHDRIYVADSGNRRVQVFQLGAPMQLAAKHP